MVNTVCNALQHLNFRYNQIVDKPAQAVFRLGIAIDNGRVDCFIDVRILNKQVLVTSNCPVIVPENKRKLISEFITRANSGLILGNFDLDFEDGELKYKSNYVYHDSYPQSEEIFIRNLVITFDMMDRYLPGIMAVLYANVEPKTAIAQIEDKTEPTLN